MARKNSLRQKVRFICFSVAAFAVMGGFAISGHTLANKYRQDLEYSYTRALNELSDYISNLEITLTKGIYANTLTQQQGLANKIMSQSMGAKCALEQLPVSFEDAQNINKFISQTSEYANFLSNNSLKGNVNSDENWENLKKLGSYAKSLNGGLKELLIKVNQNPKSITHAVSFANSYLKKATSSEPTYMKTGFKELNDGFADYPTLIYDGPFSDHITRMKSKFLENEPELTLENAKKKVAVQLSLNENEFANLANIDGNLPCYRFSTPLGELVVTKNGGYIKSLLNESNVGNLRLNFNDAKKKAEAFMRQIGFESLKESYYIINNGVCTINYAFCQDNVIFYKDLIKVGVELDTGNIVFFDATGYLMNHTDRGDATSFPLSLEKVKKSVSPKLMIKNSNKVFIPTAGLDEVACYEFECIGENKDKVLVYVNAKTGLEEQIFVVIDSKNGTLVM